MNSLSPLIDYFSLSLSFLLNSKKGLRAKRVREIRAHTHTLSILLMCKYKFYRLDFESKAVSLPVVSKARRRRKPISLSLQTPLSLASNPLFHVNPFLSLSRKHIHSSAYLQATSGASSSSRRTRGRERG